MRRTAIVVGAGVIGVTSAYSLARRGWRVTLVDSADGPAMGTSHANGAQLSYAYTDALGSPSALASLPTFLAGKGGVAFGVKWRLDYLCWLARFARNCSPGRFKRNTLEVLKLAAQSRKAMDRLNETHKLDFGHRVAGKIHLLYSQDDERHAACVLALKKGAGVDQTIIPRAGLPELDPALEGLDTQVVGAISTPSEVVGDPFRFCSALLPVLTEEYGVEARFGAAVASLSDRGDRAQLTLAGGEELAADAVVVATGVASNALLAPLGHSVNVQAMKGYSFEMPLTSGSPDLSVTDGKRRIVFTNLGDRMRVAGVAELGNESRSIDPARAKWMLDAARDCLPDGGDYAQADKIWTGLRPVTPNSQPIIRRASRSVAINTGHGSLGWTLAMGSAERLCQLFES